MQGDFNAEFQISREHSCFDGSQSRIEEGTNQTNENCMLFLQYCQTNKLLILNTWFDHPIHHRVTWHHPNGRTKKVYDYSLSGSWLRRFIQDVRVRNSYFNSDHRLLVTKFLTPCNKAARYLKRGKKVIKPDLEQLQNDVIKENVISEINKYLEENDSPGSIDEMQYHLVNALHKGRQQIPKQTKSQQIIPWQHDQNLQMLNNQRTQLHKQNTTAKTTRELKQLNKQINKKAKEIRNKTFKAKGKELNSLKQQRQMTKLWKNAKQHSSIITRKPKPIQCPGLKTHFRKHFNPNQSNLQTPLEISNPPEYIQVLQDSNLQINNLPPSDEDISTAIKQLNNGKISTDIEAEIVKLAYNIPIFKTNIKLYFEKIWTQQNIPDAWRSSSITPIWKKKGSALDASKYRGISTSSILSKVGMNIILKRLSMFYESQLKSTQFGFRSGVGCNDAIYMAKQLQEISSIAQKSMYVCFIDLTAAFDHVNRNILFQTIRNRLATNQVTTNIDLLENLYNDTTSYIQNDNPITDSFPTNSGVRQGGMEGPPLYNLYADYALRVFEDRKVEDGISGLSIPFQIPNEATNRTQRSEAPTSGTCEEAEDAYADDLALFSWSIDGLEKSVKILIEVFTDFGLAINYGKTETMVFNWSSSNSNSYPDSILTLNGHKIENNSTFKYLGVWITADDTNIGKTEIDYRINIALNAFAEHKKLLTNMSIHLQTRILFLNALIRSKLTYGCHAWRPTASELDKLNATYRYILRCMVRNGHSRVNPPPDESDSDSTSSTSDNSTEEPVYDWRYVINNQQLNEITRTKTITEFYHQQQEKWIAHIIRRNNMNTCKQLTFHSIKRKKRGRRSLSILERAAENSGMSMTQFLKASFMKANLP